MNRTPIKRKTRIKSVSTRRAAELRVYAKKRKAFLTEHPFCQVCLENSKISHAYLKRFYCLTIPAVPRSVDIHHKAGRTGWRLNDESQWMAVSRKAHEWIHQHPSEARKRGWLV